ncbi:MAG: N-6 DNA methylase [Fusobacterium gastrosuis]|uniref:N-6 DNA methylase n=1 Tax=Fusobacterium gastrosuis TaxID=1755100 RepID=UPI002A94C6B3|nr:N-6 DNA methylase [Fusobacteriaceae bacterium]MDY5794305.1 N-6 DNA methylase [Fusobacterium gastrosuis]
MLNYSELTIDALGVFYHEFIKYSGGDGKGLGIVLTPEHLTDFMCDLAKINKNTKVLDICCGSRVIIMTEANSSINKRVLGLLSKLKTRKINSWCTF